MEKRIHSWLTAINYIMATRIVYIDTFLKNHPTKDFAIGLWLHNWPYQFNEETGARKYLVPKNINAKIYDVLRRYSLRYVSFGYHQKGQKVKVHGKTIANFVRVKDRDAFIPKVPLHKLQNVEQLAECMIISERRIIKEKVNADTTYDDEIK